MVSCFIEFQIIKRNLQSNLNKCSNQKLSFSKKSQKINSRKTCLCSSEKQEDKKVKEKFISWLSYNNVHIFNKSSWGRAPHQCFISNETTDEGEPCGRGLIAFRKIPQGEKIVEIPENLILKADELKIQSSEEDLFNEYDSLAVSLIKEKAMGDKSKWKIYFDILPREEDLNLSFRWTIQDVMFLKGSKSANASIYLKEKVRTQFERLERTIFKKNRLKYPKSIFSLMSWEWALSVILSRAIFLQNLKKVCLVPYADFMNHNPFSSSYIDSKKITFSKNNEIIMYADKDYNKFDQIFTTYGQKTNLELLVLYGFILERNPFDSIELRISISGKDLLFEKKERFMMDCEKSSQITFPIFYYKYPKELYEFLRFCALNEEDLKGDDISNFDFNEDNNLNFEKTIRKIVFFSCEKALKNYSKKLLEEVILNSDIKNILISKNQKIALKQRKCEKKIIQRLNENLKRDFK